METTVMETAFKNILVVTIEHNKPLPTELTDLVANRVYDLLYAKNCPAQVTVGRYLELEKDKGQL